MRYASVRHICSVLFILFFITTATGSAVWTGHEKHRLTPTGDTLYVGGSGPGNYTTIQEAIDNATNESTVFVYAESSPYIEHIIINKSIRLIGEQKETTIIDGGTRLSVLTITVDGVVLSSFTIRHSGVLWINSGIDIRSSHNTISGNILTENHNGISLYYPSGSNTITNNDIETNMGNGIDLYQSDHNLLSWNVIAGNYGGMVLDTSEDNNISGNVFYHDGIVMLSDYQNTLTNNLVNDKPLVFLQGISTMDIEDAGQVILISCRNILIHNCNLSDTSIGIYLRDTDNCYIINNTISSCAYGVIALESRELNISMNTIRKNTDGLYMNVCDHSIILRNIVAVNTGLGIGLDNSPNNTISRNDIRFNGGVYGLTPPGFGISLINASHTRVDHNNFFFNVVNANPTDSPFCTYYGNYWNRPRLLPKVIIGLKPVLQFDWHPALTPNDIGLFH
jgi:parallel beta-helix repeat protein